MKTILRTVPQELEMRYDEKFTSDTNSKILRELIPHLVNAMKRYKTSYSQVKKWLQALHKHRRVRLLYKQRGHLDRDNRRLHKNNRTSEVNKSNFRIILKFN
jgi:predicted patatin/cPLA2 family phospholipase